MTATMAFRQVMSRLAFAEIDTVEAKAKGAAIHEKRSQEHRDALVATLRDQYWGQDQIDKITERVKRVDWFEMHGIDVAAGTVARKSNNSGKMQCFESMWQYFKNDEWNDVLEKLPCSAKTLVFNRIIGLQGYKLSEDSWKRISVGLGFLERPDMQYHLFLAPEMKHDMMEKLKAVFKKHVRRARKNIDMPDEASDLPRNPWELKRSAPAIYAAVFFDAEPVQRLD